MTSNQKALKINLIMEMILGLAIACFLTMFKGIMATESPGSTIVHMILGGSLSFLIVFLPSVLLPYFSIRELKFYTEKRRLTLNVITKAKLVYSTSANSKPWGWAAHEKGICGPDGGS